MQGNHSYANASQAGLKNYIFGSAAFMMREDIYLIIGVSVFTLVLFFLLKKELVVSIFDPEYAKAIGVHTRIAETALLLMMILFIVLGLKCVGAILISSFLIIPCICANQHSKNLNRVLLISISVGVISSFFGTWFSTAYRGISTGPMIILFLGAITLLSMIFGRYGMIRRYKTKEKIACGKS